jgi:virginiamycin A acetyltransferase
MVAMRELAKKLMRGTARLLVLPLVASYCLERRVFDRDRAFQAYSQVIAFVPGLLGEYVRREVYRLTIRACSVDCCISFGTHLSTDNIEIGEAVYIGPFSIMGHSRIGKNTLIGSRVSIIAGLHQHGINRADLPVRDQEGTFQVVRIEEDCFVGEGAIIAADVGKHSVISTGSVVFRDVAPYSIMKGNPATLVRMRARPTESTPAVEAATVSG